MRKIILFSLMFLAGCNVATITSEKTVSPPVVQVEIAGESFEMERGSYCWGTKRATTCADKAGPEELVKDKEALLVKAGEQVTFSFPEGDKPNTENVYLILEDQQIAQSTTDYKFSAPIKTGEYIIVFVRKWEKTKTKESGDSSYAFKIKIE